MLRFTLPHFGLLGPGTVFLALMLGSCSKLDFDEETVTQTFDDPVVHEVDCGSLTTTSFSGWDIDSETGSAETIATGGNPPYAYEWADSTGSLVGLTPTLLDLQPGPYSVIITDSVGCSIADTIEVQMMDTECEWYLDVLTSNDLTGPTTFNVIIPSGDFGVWEWYVDGQLVGPNTAEGGLIWDEPYETICAVMFSIGDDCGDPGTQCYEASTGG